MGDKEVGMEAPFARDAIGIVVQGGRSKEHRPKAVAFVWGGKVRPQPSLPYGRWKGEVRPAA
jgi:hypothetical protein